MKKIVVFLFVLLTFCSNIPVNAQTSKNPSHTRGYSSIVETGLLVKDGFSGEYANISLGYNALPGLFVGLGTGVKNQNFNTPLSTKSILAPTFIQVRYSPLNRSVSPFVDFKGGLISDYTASIKHQLSPSQKIYGCGHFFRIGIGVEYKRYSIYFGDDWSQLQFNDATATSSDYAWTFGVAIKF